MKFTLGSFGHLAELDKRLFGLKTIAMADHFIINGRKDIDKNCAAMASFEYRHLPTILQLVGPLSGQLGLLGTREAYETVCRVILDTLKGEF